MTGTGAIGGAAGVAGEERVEWAGEAEREDSQEEGRGNEHGS